jgi:hypothetical protein
MGTFSHLSNKSTATRTCWAVLEEIDVIWYEKGPSRFGDESIENPSRKSRSRKQEQTDEINPNLEGNQSKPRRGKRKRAKKRTSITDVTYLMLHDRSHEDEADEATPD